jgi:fructose-1,6-bisphosphatase I
MASTLEDHLAGSCEAGLAAVIGGLAGTSIALAERIAHGALAGAGWREIGVNAAGDAQKQLDLYAHEAFHGALQAAPVAALASEESDAPIALQAGAPYAVAIDPLDGSSNIDTNVSIGTIFSILPMAAGADPAGIFLGPGRRQAAAGFVIYGPQTALVLTRGQGSDLFVLDRAAGRFVLVEQGLRIPEGRREYAINASNYRHWDEPVRAYVDDCIAGADGPHGTDFNMRWIASLVAEAYRILIRGGVFLYPRDGRRGYQNGRLRLVYEANPLAFVVEQAGGGATDGERRILDLEPVALHQRVPLVFGCRSQVERVAAFVTGRLPPGERSPLFGRRGLFRL